MRVADMCGEAWPRKMRSRGDRPAQSHLSNIAPQDHNVNSGVWNEIENTVRGFACADEAVLVATGPFITNKVFKTIGKSKVAVPDGFYKVVYCASKQKMIGFIVPNRPLKGKPKQFVVSVDEVEKLTGYDFFRHVPQPLQDRLEAASDPSLWNWSRKRGR